MQILQTHFPLQGLNYKDLRKGLIDLSPPLKILT